MGTPFTMTLHLSQGDIVTLPSVYMNVACLSKMLEKSKASTSYHKSKVSCYKSRKYKRMASNTTIFGTKKTSLGMRRRKWREDVKVQWQCPYFVYHTLYIYFVYLFQSLPTLSHLTSLKRLPTPTIASYLANLKIFERVRTGKDKAIFQNVQHCIWEEMF